ncbi:hypothetical protein [Streptomyces cinereoruber]|uniref:hypothetical protein n=1 Tax=Streptomyces cinereoruber TaxID=67260 RepID=UPI00365B6B4C
MSTSLVRRPTEGAAIAAASRSRRTLPPVPVVLADLLAAYARGDRHGVNLCAHLAVRAAGEKVGEQ